MIRIADFYKQGGMAPPKPSIHNLAGMVFTVIATYFVPSEQKSQRYHPTQYAIKALHRVSFLVNELVEDLLTILEPQFFCHDFGVELYGRYLSNLTVFRLHYLCEEQLHELELEVLEIHHCFPRQLRTVIGPVHCVHQHVRGLLLAAVLIVYLPYVKLAIYVTKF